MSQVRQYELVYILSPDATDQEVADLHTQIEAIITRYQGELVKTENWGRRKLAFRIGKHREGTYVLEVFKGTGELTKELDRRLKVIDSVIRHLCVRVDEDLRLAERTRARRDAETQRRIARGLPVGGRSRRSDDDGGDDEPTDRAEV
ncbi:MAG: 30S ribosomal protein S6 [Vicinamibacterales bacterium]|jgi:small subunit ribosomal protein S6|nr:30S ribosomal protein S6 [Vicinamibacterales bacterium]